MIARQLPQARYPNALTRGHADRIVVPIALPSCPNNPAGLVSRSTGRGGLRVQSTCTPSTTDHATSCDQQRQAAASHAALGNKPLTQRIDANADAANATSSRRRSLSDSASSRIRTARRQNRRRSSRHSPRSWPAIQAALDRGDLAQRTNSFRSGTATTR